MTSTKKSLLIVDDDRTIRTMLERVLAKHYDVRLASDGAQALEEIQRRRPDAMILDLRMPVLDGWQVLERLDQAGPTLPVIVISADVKGAALTSPLVRVRLPKPVSMHVLLEACASVLGGSGGEGDP